MESVAGTRSSHHAAPYACTGWLAHSSYPAMGSGLVLWTTEAMGGESRWRPASAAKGHVDKPAPEGIGTVVQPQVGRTWPSTLYGHLATSTLETHALFRTKVRKYTTALEYGLPCRRWKVRAAGAPQPISHWVCLAPTGGELQIL